MGSAYINFTRPFTINLPCAVSVPSGQGASDGWPKPRPSCVPVLPRHRSPSFPSATPHHGPLFPAAGDSRRTSYPKPIGDISFCRL